MAEKRREAKGKGEKKRVGKTRNLFKKVGDIKGTFHAKMGTIKNTHGNVLREA